jgi:hypothetical protein
MGSEQKITVPPLGCDTERVITEFSGGAGKVLVHGTTTPVDGAEGYAPGCIFMNVDGGDGDTFFVNEGTLLVADFNLVTLS